MPNRVFYLYRGITIEIMSRIGSHGGFSLAHVLKNKALLSNRATAIATIGIKLGHLEASNPKFFAKSLKQ